MRRFAPLAPRRSTFVRLFLGASVAVVLAMSTIQAQIPGRNVNMVSGTKWPEGDPFLQRQNEPSVAASTRNPLHLLGGSNDYRTVDVPGMPDGEETGDAWLGLFKSTDGGQRWISTLLPGYPQDQSPAGLASPLKNYQAGADAVVRAGTNGLIYYSGLVFDRAENGKSGVFLARFIDNNNQEAGDPIAYLGTKLVASSNGAKFLDKPWMAVDVPRNSAATCTVTSDSIVPTAQNGHRRKHGWDRDERHDGNDDNRGRSGRNDHNDRDRRGRPSPKPPKPVVQKIPAGAVYVAYSSITGDAATLRSEILITRSMDCGNTWSAPIKVSRPEDAVNQGSTITIDPKTGAVFVGWRRFDPDLTDNVDLDAIMMARLPFGAAKFDAPTQAHKFPKPTRRVGRKLHRLFEHRDNRFKDIPANEANENLDQFDLGTTGYNFRTNAYPTMAADGTGRIYIAWTQRGYSADSGVADGARIVIATTKDARTFTTPRPVDNHATPGRGHQLMPSMAFAGGKLMLVFYDLRDSKADTHNRISSDFSTNTGLRQTIDIRSAMASPGDNPVFEPSVKVSDYLMGFNPESGEVEELQVNPPNLPMFKQGTVPFIGDYIDVAAAPAFVPGKNGKWEYNTANTGEKPMFHAVWTDNRDVRPPRNGEWWNYTPAKMSPDQLPSASIFDPTQAVPQCVDGAGNPGSRNQNVYSARITGGLLAGSPGNAKPLSADMQRGFVVFAQNTSKETKSFRMTILSQPVGGRASFEQFPLPPYTSSSPAPETAIEMIVPPLSTASRTVYVTSTDARATLSVDVSELGDLRLLANKSLYPTAPEKTGGLEARVLLNPDIENPDIENPDIENPDIENPDIENVEVYNPDIENPDIENPDIENPDIENPDIENPDIENPDIENPDIENVRVANPDIENPDIENPDIENPDIENPDIENPDIENPDIENGAIADITWKVTNNGNTTASFNVNLFLAQQNLPAGVKAQLVLLKTYRTPVTVPNGCQLGFQTRNVLLANIRNPILVPPGGGTANANDPAETNATLWLAPGEEGRIVLRVIDEDTSNNVPITKANGDVEYVDPALVPTEDVSPIVQQQAVNSDDAEGGVTVPPVVPPPAPPATNDTIWTSPGSPVRVNVLANDAALFGSTKIISTHTGGLAQNLGGSPQELVYMPTTGLLYVGGARSVGVVDPASNHLVARLPIDPSDPGVTYGRLSPATGIVFFRMGGNGQPGSSIYAYDGRPLVGGDANPNFNKPVGISLANDTAINNLGNAYTFTLGNSGTVLYYLAGTLSGSGPASTSTATLAAIDANPTSPNVGSIMWQFPLPANARPMHVVQNPANGKIYIAALNVGSASPQGGVYVMNPAAPGAPAKITSVDSSISLAVNPATNLIFAAGAVGGFRLNAIDGATDTLLNQLALPGGGTRSNNAEDRLVVHYPTGKVYLRTPNHVFVVDGLKGSPTFNAAPFVQLGVGPEFNNSDLVVNQATGVVVSAGNFIHGITVIDTATNAATLVEAPRAIGELAVDTTSARVFAADFLNSVHQIDTSGPSVTSSLALVPETGMAIPNPVTNRAYVSGADEFTDIFMVSGLGELGSLPTLSLSKGRWGFGARHDASNSFFFVNNASDIGAGVSRPGALVKINGTTDAVTDLVGTIGQPYAVGVNQATGQVIVAGLSGMDAAGANESGKIRIHEAGNPSSWVDANTAAVVPLTPTNPTVSYGRHVVTNPATNLSYVMIFGGSDTSVVYLPPAVLPGAVGPIVTPITLPASFGAVTFNASDRVEVIRTLDLGGGNSRVFLGTFNGTQIKVVALDGTNTVVGAYAGTGSSRPPTGTWLEVNPNDQSLFVVDYNADTVTKLDGATLALQATTPLPDGPSSTTFSVSQNRLYVSSIDSKTITALNGSSLAVISSVRLPLQALILRVNESEGRIYTTGANSPDESGVMVISDVAGQLGAPVSVTSATDGAGGTTTVNPEDYSITYQPALGFSGTDTFTYTAHTPAGDSTATVTVNVIPVATVPFANNDAFAMQQGGTLNVNVGRGVLSNDVVSNFATMQVVQNPAHGILTPSLTNPGQFSYTPTGPYTGSDSFKYIAVDGMNSNVATVSINVLVPANPLIVTNTGDTGSGSLRNAINYANSTAGAQTITFNIATGPMGPPFVITPQTALPVISDTVTIDGLTQPGSSANNPRVVLSGAAQTGVSHGLVVNGDGSLIRGLVIHSFAQSGQFTDGSAILLNGNNNTVEASFIGTTDTGAVPAVLNYNGVKITGSNNRVGGTTLATRNLIAGNAQGVWVLSGSANVVAFNTIGTNYAGSAVVPAIPGATPFGNQFGVLVDGGTGTVIGIGPSLSNVISGNSVGVLLRGGSGTTIAANNIGLGMTGLAAIPNGDGISLYAGPFGVPADTTIGGNPGTSTNRISGNAGWGINIDGATVTNTWVFGNTIGLNLSNAAVGNVAGGIRNSGAAGTKIGEPGRGNIISSNDGPSAFGILINGNTDGATIQANKIGTDPAGTGARPNGPAGGDNAALFVDNGSSDVLIGGSIASGEGNLISGNSAYGVKLWGNNNQVMGNLIGTNGSGTAALPNGKYGVHVERGTSNVIGAPGGFRNVVSGNANAGIVVSGTGFWAGAFGTQITGNAIGVDAGFTTVIPNNGAGVDLRETTSSEVVGNTIRGNTGAGVAVWFGTTGNLIVTNSIYGNGGLGIDLENDGPTANDGGDADTGSNNRQNFPVLSAAVLSGGTTTIDFSTVGFAGGTYRLDFYVSASCLSGGQTFLGTTTASNGVSASVPLTGSVSTGQFITATATDGASNTSEFSACRVVTLPPPPPAVITSVTPNPSAPGFGQHLYIRGTNLPGVNPSDVILNFAGSDNIAQNIWHISPTLVVARFTLGTPVGAATIRIKSPSGAIVSNSFPVTLSATPGAPIMTAISTGCAGGGFLSAANPGDTIYVSAEGIDTSGVTVVFTPTSPAGAPVAVVPVSTCGGAGAMSAQVTVPSFLNLTATTVNVQIRTTVGANTSALSNASSLTVNSSLNVVGPAGGAGAPWGPYYCPAGFPGNGLRVATNDTPVNDIWGNVNYDVTAAELMCSNSSSTTKFGGGPTANTSLQCATGELLVGMFGAVDGAVLGSIGPRCQNPAGGSINQPWGARPAGGTPFTFDCPANKVVVGVQGGSGTVLDSLALICGPKP